MGWELAAGLTALGALLIGTVVFFLRRGAKQSVLRKHAEKSAKRAQEGQEIDEEVARMSEPDLDDKLRDGR